MGNTPDIIIFDLGKLGNVAVVTEDPRSQEVARMAALNMQRGRLRVRNGNISEKLGEYDAWVRSGIYVPADTSSDSQLTLEDELDLADAVEAGVVEVGRFVEQPQKDVKYRIGRGVRRSNVAREMARMIPEVEKDEIEHIQETAASIPWVD